MSYRHRQRGKLHYVLLALALATAVLLPAGQGPVRVVLALAAGAALLLSLCFATLTVRDAGDSLVLVFGPLPLFRRRLRYAEMRGARPGRCLWIDGLGIHWVPTRGWIYNVWGADCVEIEFSHNVVRVGTDDAAALAAFLRQRIPSP